MSLAPPLELISFLFFMALVIRTPSLAEFLQLRVSSGGVDTQTDSGIGFLRGSAI
jgi:hypothetical protein